MADSTVTPSRIKNLSGIRFGRLTAIEPTSQRSNGCRFVVWKCRCDCGAELSVLSGNLRSGHTKSCECLKLDVITKHGSARDGKVTTEYRIWRAMNDRCRNTNNVRYADYGGRGITICDRWLFFENFLADMGPRPPRMSIEREDNSRGYSPDNCKWATQSEQLRNTRRNRNLTFNGETMCLSDWAIKTGLSRGAIQNRLDRGWEIERILTQKTESSPRNNICTRFLTHNGQTRSLVEWAEITTISTDTIAARIKLGWSVAKSLTHPVRPMGKR